MNFFIGCLIIAILAFGLGGLGHLLLGQRAIVPAGIMGAVLGITFALYYRPLRN